MSNNTHMNAKLQTRLDLGSFTCLRRLRITSVVCVLFLMAGVADAKFSHGSANARGGSSLNSSEPTEEELLRQAEERARKRKANEEKAKLAKEIWRSKKIEAKKSRKGLVQRVSGFVTHHLSFGLSDNRARFSGYLYNKQPAGLRFAESVDKNKRVPSPALPEFSLLSHDHESYLLETPLSEEELRDNSFYSEVIVEMEPHILISGNIEYGSDNLEMTESERLTMEEEREAILKPEDVLIFFEAESRSGNSTSVVVPFSPSSIENSEPIKSSATYQVVE
ncbi:hypothetical protein MLD52_01695 [Puniceicoccaceae bacterium K14]|nr:hypothetical protein [Puniceicoccaceae bacterium K14]